MKIGDFINLKVVVLHHYMERRVTDVTKETLTRQVISPMIHLTFFLSQKIDISVRSSIHLEKKIL